MEERRRKQGGGGIHPLRIGISVLNVRPGVNGGGEIYVRSLVEALRRVDEVNEYVLFVTPRNASLFDGPESNFRLEICPFPGRVLEVYQRIAWEWALLRWQAARHHLQVVHFAANLVPPAFPTATVLTAYDFSSIFYRDHFPSQKTTPLGLDRLLDRERIRSCRRADRVATLSDFTTREVLARTGVDAGRVRTVHLAPRGSTAPQLDEATRTVARYGVRPPYVLSVATLSPHKNLARLLEAFSREAGGALSGYQLVLVGGTHFEDAASELRGRIRALGLEERVVTTGYVPDADVPSFYRAAKMFVFPSLYEGFGLPVLEAAECGTPVAASRAASIPEVGGDAVLYFDPMDVNDIARAMREIAGSAELCRMLAERGERRAAEFTWDRTGREMVLLYADAAAARAGTPADAAVQHSDRTA